MRDITVPPMRAARRAGREHLSSVASPGVGLQPVICATPDNVPAIATLAAYANRDMPTMRWLVPDQEDRADVLRRWYAIIVEHALSHGHVDVLADRSAAAIWLDHTQSLPGPVDYQRRLTAACGPYTDVAELLQAVFVRHRPHRMHLRLTVLAADEPAQGAALLQHRNQRLDRAGAAAYAHADTEAHLEMLIEAGYRTRSPFRLPAGPMVWPVLRAHPAQAASDEDAPVRPPDIT